MHVCLYYINYVGCWCVFAPYKPLYAVIQINKNNFFRTFFSGFQIWAIPGKLHPYTHAVYLLVYSHTYAPPTPLYCPSLMYAVSMLK